MRVEHQVDWADGNAASFFKDINLCNLDNIYLKYSKATDTTSYTSD